MSRIHVHNNYKAPFPHIIHLLLTVFSCGMWLPVWVLHRLLSSRP